MGSDSSLRLAGKVIPIDRYIPANLPQRHVGDSGIRCRRSGGGIEYKIVLFFPSYSLDCRVLILVLQLPLDQEQSRAGEYI
jgi:hypothetical protein